MKLDKFMSARFGRVISVVYIINVFEKLTNFVGLITHGIVIAEHCESMGRRCSLFTKNHRKISMFLPINHNDVLLRSSFLLTSRQVGIAPPAYTKGKKIIRYTEQWYVSYPSLTLTCLQLNLHRWSISSRIFASSELSRLFNRKSPRSRNRRAP